MNPPAAGGFAAGQAFMALHGALVRFARQLAASQWHASGTFEPTKEDLIDRARAETKADIGRALLEALGEGEEVP